MLNWIDNTHADYVLAAYGFAFLTLLGLAIVSLCAWRNHAKEWLRITQTDENDTQ